MGQHIAILLTALLGSIAARGGLPEEMVRAHNAIRAKVGVGPLEWSEQLAGFATDWARRLAARHDFVHRPNNPNGENLFVITGASATPAQVVANWASEARDYDAQSNSCRRVCG